MKLNGILLTRYSHTHTLGLDRSKKTTFVTNTPSHGTDGTVWHGLAVKMEKLKRQIIIKFKFICADDVRLGNMSKSCRPIQFGKSQKK